MDKFDFEDYFEFSERLIAILDKMGDKYLVITVYGKYAEIKSLLENLIINGISVDGGICLEDEDMAGYDKEFVLYLTLDGVSVNKAWHEDNKFFAAGYSCSGGDLSLVHEDCNSKILKYIESGVIYEFCIKDKNDNLLDTDNDLSSFETESTYISRTKDGTPEGFTKIQTIIENGFTRTITFSYYSDDIDYLKDKAEFWDIKLYDE